MRSTSVATKYMISDQSRQVILWTLGAALIAVVIAWALYEIREVLLLLYVSGLLAVGFSPLVRAIERQRLVRVGTRLPRWFAILVLYLAILGLVTLVLLVTIPPLVRQVEALANDLPAVVDRLQRWLLASGIIDREITWREAVEKAPGTGGGTLGPVLSAVSGFVGGVVGIVTVLILTFYVLIETESLFATLLRLFPVERRVHLAAVAREITIKVSAWLVGQLVLALSIGVTAALGLWLLGVPYFFVLALIAALGEFIPIVGPILAAVPAVLVAFTVSPMTALAVALFYLVQQQVENHVLVPKLMSHQVGLSAVAVIVSLLVGGSLLGVVGVILAIPTAAIVQVLIQELTTPSADLIVEHPPPAAPES